MSKWNILTKGFFKENPSLILVLGTCPTLAVTTSVNNAIGMGAATTFVLLMSNILISLLKNVIPDKVRIPCFIVIIATFVSMVDLGRAEAFASKNGVWDSILDGLGMGIGFTISLILIATVREVLGAGAFMGHQFIPADYNILIFVLAPGAFIVYGFIMALVRHILNKVEAKRKAKCAVAK